MQQASIFADVKQTQMPTDVDIVQFVGNFILTNSLELSMFFSAVLGYFILCCTRLPKFNVQDKQGPCDAEVPVLLPQTPATKLEGSTASLSQMVKSMRLDQKDAEVIVNDLRVIIRERTTECDMTAINDLLNDLCEHPDSQLMQMIFDMLPSVGLNPDQRTYECFLKMHVAARDFYEIQALVAEMQAKNVPLSNRAAFFAMKGALQVHDFAHTLKYFKILKASWEVCKTTEPLVPQSIMMLLLDLACEVKQLGQLIREVRGIPLSAQIIDAILAKCVESSDSDMVSSVEILARAQRETLPDSTYGLLIKAAARKPARVKKIIEEVMNREGSTFAPDLALSMLEFCTGSSDLAMVDRLFQKMKPKQVNVIGAFIWFYIGAEKFEKACDVYELDMEPVCSQAGGIHAMDASLQESIIDAAVLSGRTLLAERLMTTSRSEPMDCGRLVARAGELLKEGIAVLARCNATVSYWIVLIF